MQNPFNTGLGVLFRETSRERFRPNGYILKLSHFKHKIALRQPYQQKNILRPLGAFLKLKLKK